MNRTEASHRLTMRPPGWRKGSTGYERAKVLIARPCPRYSIVRFHEKHRIAGSIHDLLEGESSFIGPGRRFADNRNVVRVAAWRVLLVHWTVIRFRHLLDELDVLRAIPGLAKIVLLVQLCLFQIGQDQHAPAMRRIAVFIWQISRWETTVLFMVVMHGERKKLQVVRAHHSLRGATSIDTGHQQRNRKAYPEYYAQIEENRTSIPCRALLL